MLILLFLTAYFLFIPSIASAWGPLTHMYLGTEVYYLAPLLPAGVAELIRRHRQDFLYGNIIADIVLAKKYMPDDKNSHSWDFASDLAEAARTEPGKAFSLGYMSHLAADTVAHGRYTAGRRNIEHTFLELGADSIVHRGYWLEAMGIDKAVQARNDALLEKCLDVVVFSFKTNKRVFKGALALSCLNNASLAGLFTASSTEPGKRRRIEGLHEESLDRMADVLSNGARSEVLKKNPIGGVRRNRLFKALLS